ncbi:hypothetical protein RhiirB3_430153 [Rhizophagus irregularis]|nr:hypothetical protein RhiirB3_430153 [Rhizophagus irregularis]
MTLPTLDILNRNYPLIMKDENNCLFCNDTPETNHHIWTCPVTYTIIQECFVILGDRLIEIIKRKADKLSLVVSDSIKYSKTFRWSYRKEPIHPVALLLLKSYITNDMVGIFRSHFNKASIIIQHLLPFVQECSSLFKSNIWKIRNQKWKVIKSAMGLTKLSFKNYHKNFKDFNNPVTDANTSRRIRRVQDHIYTNPHNDFRNFKLDKDFLFILFSSSNFLHSGPFFKHLECNDRVTYLTSSNLDNSFPLYNV